MRNYTQKNSARIPLVDLFPLRMPLGLCVEPTTHCNFKCIQCPVSLPQFERVSGPAEHMDMDLFRKIVGDVQAMGKLKNLNLYGDGEPLLNKNIVEMVRLARTADISDPITITSNGAALTETVSRGLIDAGLTYLRVSIYGTDDEENARVTGSRVKLSKIQDNLRRLRELRERAGSQTPFLYVKMIDAYSEKNEVFVNTYKDIADQVNIETPMNWNGYDGIDLISRIDPNGKTDQTKVQGFYEERGRSGYRKICTTPFHSLNIKRNGDVCICIVDWNHGTVVGNIKDESLSDIWFGPRLRAFRLMHVEGRRHENESCRNCKYLYCNPENIDHLTGEALEDALGRPPSYWNDLRN